MSAVNTHIAHHFDDAEQQSYAAALGIWAFLATEILFFGGLFAAYALYRNWYHEAFISASHHLDMWLGFLNTAILLTSSLFVALAVRAAQMDHQTTIVRCLSATILLGTVFLGIKGFEYHQKFEDNLVPGVNFEFIPPIELVGGVEKMNRKDSINSVDANHAQLFFAMYFALTGLHAIHMIIGLVVFGALVFMAWNRSFSSTYYTPLEVGGLYWHFVDIIWVFLFPLLYLVR